MAPALSELSITDGIPKYYSNGPNVFTTSYYFSKSKKSKKNKKSKKIKSKKVKSKK